MKSKGNYAKATKYLKKLNNAVDEVNLDYYGRMGVEALAAATPVDSGKTAASWSYEILRDKDTAQLHFVNDNVNDGVPIAIIYQYGHATGTGGWVVGEDYINPAIQPVFDEMVEKFSKEVTQL